MTDGTLVMFILKMRSLKQLVYYIKKQTNLLDSIENHNKKRNNSSKTSYLSQEKASYQSLIRGFLKMK